MTEHERRFDVGDRVGVIGPGAFHGEIGHVRAVRDDGALLFESEAHGDRNWLDPRCLSRLAND